MKGRERMLTALSGGRPDTVPVWELAFNEASVINIARHFMDEDQLPPIKNIMDMTDEELFQTVNAFKVMGTELGNDGFTATSMAPMERVDADHFRDVFGVIHRDSEKGEPYPIKGPINGPDDLKRYKMRSPEEGDFLFIDIMRTHFPDCAIAYMLNGPFFMSRCLRGSLENLLMDYVLNPELVKELARITTDFCLEALEFIAKKGADFVVNDCDLAFNLSTMMSPAQYDEFVGPFQKEIVERGHELGLKMVKHTDGVIHPLIPRFIEEGYDGLHPIQPQCMDIGEVKREWGGKICIMGNIDCAFLLVFGTPDEVRETVKQTISVAAQGGGYIISSSNTIHPGVKPENYIALVEAAREYGKY